jgi:hypothetical protein
MLQTPPTASPPDEWILEILRSCEIRREERAWVLAAPECRDEARDEEVKA